MNAGHFFEWFTLAVRVVASAHSLELFWLATVMLDGVELKYLLELLDSLMAGSFRIERGLTCCDLV